MLSKTPKTSIHSKGNALTAHTIGDALDKTKARITNSKYGSTVRLKADPWLLQQPPSTLPAINK